MIALNMKCPKGRTELVALKDNILWKVLKIFHSQFLNFWAKYTKIVIVKINRLIDSIVCSFIFELKLLKKINKFIFREGDFRIFFRSPASFLEGSMKLFNLTCLHCSHSCHIQCLKVIFRIHQCCIISVLANNPILWITCL